MIVLRPYQRKAVAAIVEAFREKRSTLLVFPTGCGKTATFSHLANMASKGRVLCVAHRDELIEQAAGAFERATGEQPTIEKADRWANESTLLGPKPKIVVSSVQTLIAGWHDNRRRMERFDPHEFSMLICDEAHRSTAKSWRAVIDYFTRNPSLRVLGVTATPDRHDKSALGQIYESVAMAYELDAAIRDGWLVPIHSRQIHVESLDFSEIKTCAGDFAPGQLAELMEYEKNLHAIADPTYELHDGRKAIIFCVSVHHAERLAEILNRHEEGCAGFVCGKTPDDERRQTVEAYREGSLKFMCNVGCFTEGFDAPATGMIVCARPTKSRALYCQMIGRGTRTFGAAIDTVEPESGQLLLADGGMSPAEARRRMIAESVKPYVDVVDFTGNCGKHKLISAADILGGKYSDAEIAAAKRKCAGNGRDVLEALEEAKREADEKRQVEIERRAVVKAKANYTERSIDPFAISGMKHAQEYRRIGPAATEKQEFRLKQWGIWKDGMTKAEASRLMDMSIKRFNAGLCTWKQAALLNRLGHDGNSTSREEASEIISAAFGKRVTA